jgi:hypothetical protein
MDEPRYCDICGTQMVYTRRATRGTFKCPHSTHRSHREVRALRRLDAQIANIEKNIRRSEGAGT